MQRKDYGSDGMPALSLALGWFSIALGAAELLAPRQVARLIGISPDLRTRATLRAYGAREMANGLGILTQPRETMWLWSRVGGDAIDLATLGRAAYAKRTDEPRLALATLAVLGVTAIDVLAAQSMSPPDEAFDGIGRVTGDQAITIKLPLEMVEPAWIRWCESGLGRLKRNYSVRFEPAPGARGTEVRLSSSESRSAIREELRRFKQYAEIGEIPVSDGPGLRRPAQPARDPEEVKKLVEVLQ